MTIWIVNNLRANAVQWYVVLRAYVINYSDFLRQRTNYLRCNCMRKSNILQHSLTWHFFSWLLILSSSFSLDILRFLLLDDSPLLFANLRLDMRLEFDDVRLTELALRFTVGSRGKLSDSWSKFLPLCEGFIKESACFTFELFSLAFVLTWLFF